MESPTPLDLIKSIHKEGPALVINPPPGELAKGDVPGHEFHGNQYTSGSGGGAVGEKVKSTKELSMGSKVVISGLGQHEGKTATVVANNGWQVTLDLKSIVTGNPIKIGDNGVSVLSHYKED